MEDNNNQFKLWIECISTNKTPSTVQHLFLVWNATCSFWNMHCMGIYYNRFIRKHTFGSTDTEISITDIENQCAVSKWKIDTVISTSNTGKTILQQQYLIGFFFFFFRSCCNFRKCQIPPIDIFASFTRALHISDRWWWLKKTKQKTWSVDDLAWIISDVTWSHQMFFQHHTSSPR